MGEQCCALNDLPRFVNKNEETNNIIGLPSAFDFFLFSFSFLYFSLSFPFFLGFFFYI